MGVDPTKTIMFSNTLEQAMVSHDTPKCKNVTKPNH